MHLTTDDVQPSEVAKLPISREQFRGEDPQFSG